MLEFIGFELVCLFLYLLFVIFIIVYFEYVVESYDLDVVDYLLKFIFFDCFLWVVNKVV